MNSMISQTIRREDKKVCSMCMCVYMALLWCPSERRFGAISCGLNQNMSYAIFSNDVALL